jgi:hypothetical protein
VKKNLIEEGGARYVSVPVVLHKVSSNALAAAAHFASIFPIGRVLPLI